jgi:hypothetical protein
VHVGRGQNLNIRRFVVQPDGRKFFPIGTTRNNPAFADYAYKVFDTKSTYHGLQLVLQKRFSRGLRFDFNYTFSKAMDEASSQIGGEVGGSQAGSLDPYDRSRDYGPASFDARHNSSFNFTYDLPRPEQSGFLKFLGGWQLNGILSMAAGHPVQVTTSLDQSRAGNINFNTSERPDLRPGGDGNPVVDSRNVDRYWDGSHFRLNEAGYFGNLGRNTAVIPGVITFDFSLVKAFSFSESRALQFRSEFFNLFNRANFGSPNSTVFINTTGVPSSTFGRITSTTTTARQIQFGLKFVF